MSIATRRRCLFLVAALLIGGGGLACSGSGETNADLVTDDSEGPIPVLKEARTALNRAMQAFNEHCMFPRVQSEEGYPVTLFNPDPEAPSFKYRQVQALEEIGLLNKTVAQDRGEVPVHRFSLTKKGKAAQYDIARGRDYTSMFCYAIPHVARIDSIKSVYTSDPNPLARVWFVYTFRDVSRWATSNAVQEAYPGTFSVPSPSDTIRANQLLTRIDSAWVDRRLTGFDRPPSRPSP
jgi:hypothetical protein